MRQEKYITPRPVKEAVHRAVDSTTDDNQVSQMTDEYKTWLVNTLIEIADEASQAQEPEIVRKLRHIVSTLSPDEIPPPGAVVSWCYHPVEFFNQWRWGLVAVDGTRIITDSGNDVGLDEIVWEVELFPKE